MEALPKPLGLAHELLARKIATGDTVVDATMGNGHDTLFLATLVGEAGRVQAFDIQQQALISTRQRLEQAGVVARCSLHLRSHCEMSEVVETPVSAVVFNLGYLPGADKSCVTEVDQTMQAVANAMELLKPGGVISVMCYIGHDGGAREGQAVLDWARGLDRREWRCFRYEMLNAPNDPPFLVMVERIAAVSH